MEQRVAIITGASSGIGAALARIAASEGWTVVLTARRAERLTALADEMTAKGGQVLALAGDMTKLADQQRLVDETVRAFGRLDVLVNNAGLPLATDWADSTPTELQRQWSTNVTALATLARVALPELERQHGTIINVGSSISRVAMPSWGNYAPTKIAVAALSRALRREVSSRGLKVCLVEPGPISTEFGARAGFDEAIPYSIPAEVCARAIFRLFAHPRKRLVVPGWLAVPLLLMGAVENTLPGLVDLVFKLRYRRQQSKAASAAASGS